MKKIIIGTVIGLTLSFYSIVFASEEIQAILFPVKFNFNGTMKEMSNEYVTLNYNGHAYVPVRFIAENMGAQVNFNEASNTVSIVYPSTNNVLSDENYPDLKAENIKITKTNANFALTGKVVVHDNLFEKEASKEIVCYFTVFIYDQMGNQLGKADDFLILNKEMASKGQVVDFRAAGRGDITNYASIGLKINYLGVDQQRGDAPPEISLDVGDHSVSGETLSYRWKGIADFFGSPFDISKSARKLMVAPSSKLTYKFDYDLNPIVDSIERYNLMDNSRTTESVLDNQIILPDEAGSYVYILHAKWKFNNDIVSAEASYRFRIEIQ